MEKSKQPGYTLGFRLRMFRGANPARLPSWRRIVAAAERGLDRAQFWLLDVFSPKARIGKASGWKVNEFWLVAITAVGVFVVFQLLEAAYKFFGIR